jgi:hypothetical protein
VTRDPLRPIGEIISDVIAGIPSDIEATAIARCAGVELTDDPAQRIQAVKQYWVAQATQDELTDERLLQLDVLFANHAEWEDA